MRFKLDQLRKTARTILESRVWLRNEATVWTVLKGEVSKIHSAEWKNSNLYLIAITRWGISRQ